MKKAIRSVGHHWLTAFSRLARAGNCPGPSGFPADINIGKPFGGNDWFFSTVRSPFCIPSSWRIGHRVMEIAGSEGQE